MSLLINGMDMPKNCRKCDFTHCTRFGQKLCTFLNEATSIKKKLPDCPLTEIPTPRGRLIDADVLMDLLEKSVPEKNRGHQFYVFRHMLRNAPTIIEEEE